MTDYLRPQEITASPNSPASNYKSDVSVTSNVSFGQKSEAPQPMIGFKFNSDANNAVVSIVNPSQPDQAQITGDTIVVQKILKNATSNAKLRPSSVSPVKRAIREASSVLASRPTSAIRGRALHIREVGVTNVYGMTEYINKRSQERSVELQVKATVENKKAHSKNNFSGKTVLDTTNQRRHLERQVAALENRIKRLQTEDSTTTQKIETVNTKTEQTLANKMRHCEEKATKEMRNQKRAESVQRLKEENQRNKEEQKESVRKALIGKMKGNYERAQVLKKTNEEKMEVCLQNKRKAAEEKRAAAKTLSDSIFAGKTARVAEDDSTKKEIGTRYVDKANIEKERARELSLKCKELERLETEMLAKLTATKDLLSTKQSHFSKVNAAKGVIVVNKSVTEEN